MIQRTFIEPVRRLPWPPPDATDSESIVMREWLQTNGLGGYASGTVSGVITRRYHGLLIAALPAPLGRMVMLSHVAAQVRFSDGRRFELGERERSADIEAGVASSYLTEFRLEGGLPMWRYNVEGVVIEKRLFLPHRQNTVIIVFALRDGADRLEMALRPSVNFRAQELPVCEPLASSYEFRAVGSNYEIILAGSPLPALRLRLSARDATFTLKGLRLENVLYPVEESRGYQAKGMLWSPGYFRFTLDAGQPAALIASTESFETMSALPPDKTLDAERLRRRRLIAQAAPEAHAGVPAELTLAADQFIITPVGRTHEVARAHAYGDEVRTVIAGYHWFTDWGRDTMISLEGLTLVTGRHVEAGYILRTFAHYVRNGLIPNMFPEGQNQGLYHTADATLWFFHALSRYVDASGDMLTLQLLYPTLKQIVAAHLQGTHFGIRVDARDGLLTQGAPGYQLTWMDAKVDDWIVTPRRGKPVEINALWYNALRLMEEWAHVQNDSATSMYSNLAHQVYRSFNDRFWCGAAGHLYDVVDPDDAKCRPNQVLAISLPHPVLARDHWVAVMRVVRDRLLTRFGLRSLAPGDPEYKAKYFGDLRTRDAAYHQGTVWAWLVGPFVDAWMKVFPDDLVSARHAIEGFRPHLDDGCIGSISEVFDAEQPFTPRGCIAQAWSVAELLRVWLKLEKAAAPAVEPRPMASALPS